MMMMMMALFIEVQAFIVGAFRRFVAKMMM